MQDHKALVSFSVDLNECRAHVFKISMLIHHARARQKLSLPVWTPGSYMVREFAQHIGAIKARENDCDIGIEKIDKNTFSLSNVSSSFELFYEVYGFDSSIRAAFIDDVQAFFNATALFLRPHDLSGATYRLNISRPKGQEFAEWQVATGLSPIEIDSDGFGSYQAQDYDELVDHPFQISAMKRLQFVVADIPHEIALVGDVRPFDEKRLVKDLSSLCGQQINLFVDAPFRSYLFIARFEEGGYGGLEHRNSSMLLASPYSLPQLTGEPDNHYRSFLGLCSHEYFHAWNVKRLKPKSFVHYDYDRECYTNLLWLFEGITSYYDDLLVKRAGLISISSYLELMGKNYTRLMRNVGRKFQSIAESSHDAWIKFYRPNENSMNSGTSYYLKGSWIGLYLDLLVRQSSQRQTSLDQIMREAYRRYGQGNGVTEAEIFALLSEIGGVDVKDFREKYIYGTDDLPIEMLLHSYGISMDYHADDVFLDDKIKMSAFLGLRLRFDEHGRAVIASVEHEGPAMQAALCPFDEIIAINGIRLDASNAADLLSRIKVDETLDVLGARKKAMKNFRLKTRALPVSQCKFKLRREISNLELIRLQEWLGEIQLTPLTNERSLVT